MNRVERNLGMDLNGDGYIGGQGRLMEMSSFSRWWTLLFSSRSDEPTRTSHTHRFQSWQRHRSNARCLLRLPIDVRLRCFASPSSPIWIRQWPVSLLLRSKAKLPLCNYSKHCLFWIKRLVHRWSSITVCLRSVLCNHWTIEFYLEKFNEKISVAEKKRRRIHSEGQLIWNDDRLPQVASKDRDKYKPEERAKRWEQWKEWCARVYIRNPLHHSSVRFVPSTKIG